MNKVSRYSCTVSDRRGLNGHAMVQDEQGDYVKYSTYNNVVSDLQKQIENLKAKLHDQQTRTPKNTTRDS